MWRSRRAAALGAVACGALLLVVSRMASAQCPAPPLCPTPTVTCGVALGTVPGAVNTVSESTVECSGPSTQVSDSVTTYIGPQTLCYGANKTQSCMIVAGGQDIDTTEILVLANTVGIPTLSIWGLGALVTGLGALALRRLRRLPAP
jgi:IPTL-CTERM motif